jgi:replicative DNA helicase
MIPKSKRIYKPGKNTSQGPASFSGKTETASESTCTPFPIDCLPPHAADMTRAICATERVPETLAGCCVLGILSASIGAGIEVQSGPSRVTRGNLFILASADSGSGKSETFRHAVKPLQIAEAEMLESWKAETLPKAQAEKELIEQEIGKLKGGLRKEHGAVEREDIRAALQEKHSELLKVEPDLQPPRLIVEDVTTERLAVMMVNQGECLASLSADAGAIVNNILGRYNKAERTDEILYVKAYSGDFCRVDRQTREPVILQKPCLAVLWLTQPDKIETLLAERSLTDGGLMPRFLVCHTKAEPQPITGVHPGIPPQVAQAWEQRVRELLQTFRLANQPLTIEPTPEAKQALDIYWNKFIERWRGELRDVGSYAARWCEQAWRIAVVIHAGKYGKSAGEPNLALATAQAAITLAEWFAARQLEVLAAGRYAAKRALQDKILSVLADTPTGITARDLQRARIVDSADDARALLAKMEADGELTHKESKPEGGGHVTLIYTRARK